SRTSASPLPDTQQYAERVGIALQLTNIIRDIGEDARRGRIYLPQTELQQFGVTPTSILRAEYTPGFSALVRHQIERAQQTYDAALAALPDADRRAQRP